MYRQGFRAALATVTVLLFATVSFGQFKTVTGTVRGGGEPLQGVAVTNGYQTVTTDASGRYELPCDERARLVYISTPAGYSAPVENGVIKFYKALEDTPVHNFELNRKPGDDTRHGFIAVADPQVLKESEIEKMAAGVEDIARTVADNAGYLFHGMGCGDIVFDRLHLFPKMNEALARTGLSFYHSIGNHDMDYSNRTHETSYQTYEQTYGPAWYSYNIGRIHYVVLNDTFYIGRQGYYIGYLDEIQLKWLEDDLSRIPHGSTVVLTMHIPSTVSQADRDRFKWGDIQNVLINKSALYSILENYKTHIVSGHYHTTANSVISDNIFEHNVAALSGAWWHGTNCTDGTPAGYGVFLCDGDEVNWYYKSVGHPRDYQMKLYIVERDGRAAVLANVWNTDPAWKVELFEDGKSSGEMERVEAFDPGVVEFFSDKDKLEHKWITPTEADHFFSLPVSEGTLTAEVVATDRFGNVYRESINLDK